MQTIRELMRIEIHRYRKKGFVNIVIGVTLLVTSILGFCRLGHYLWPEHITNKYLFLVGWSLLIHTSSLLGCFMLYLPGYLGSAQWYSKYRINQKSFMPWTKDKWSTLKAKTTKYLLINYIIIYPTIIVLSLLLTGLKVRFHDFPSATEIALQLLFISLVEDCCFYWAHRLSHQCKWLYQFHKTHHQYQTVFSLVTEYTHPVDYIIGIMLPSAAGFVLLGSSAHCFMLFFWQFWKMFISNEGHSGYQFPWSPTRIFLFVSGPSYHDFHHSQNAGNYCGSIYLWDYFNGSNKQYMSRFVNDKLQ